MNKRLSSILAFAGSVGLSFTASYVLGLVLILAGCATHPERLRHVHVGQCASILFNDSILVTKPDGSIRRVGWSFGEAGLACEQWNESTTWTIEIQACNGGGYHLNWAIPDTPPR